MTKIKNQKVICSECGHKFYISKENDKFIPSNCPICKKNIVYLKLTDSNYKTAQVK